MGSHVFLPNLYIEILPPQYDGVYRWGFGEIIEVKLGQRVALMLGLKPF